MGALILTSVGATVLVAGCGGSESHKNKLKPPEPLTGGDKRLEAVVQLAPADEHGPDLGELACLAGATVRLGIDGDELHRRKRLPDQGHPTGDTPWTGRFAAVLARLPARLDLCCG